ncbi:hypothetical protein CBR_g66690 [Chara braunii]|uniref:Uncharacterized protein n=1 Tax=Chara braunii TaxID=69332 RepID=A0A388JQ17_CHABU|nr:hypothetical protein CBR_g66690 [Chara braunii]|eukprot:GBG59885.1 hypothetical protein CBR_g66690 [Chara braunii]
MFGLSSSLFGRSQTGTGTTGQMPFAIGGQVGGLNFQQQQQQQQLQLLQQQQAAAAAAAAGGTHQIHLLAKDTDHQRGQPVSFSSKWEDIHPDSQRLLLQIEERILEYRDESRRLDQCQRLHDITALRRGFEDEAAGIRQNLASLATSLGVEQSSLQGLFQRVKELLRNTEVAVRSFILLGQRFPRYVGHSGQGIAGLSTTGSSGLGANSVGGGGHIGVGGTLLTSSDLYSGIPLLPSPFLHQTVARLEHTLNQYQQRVQELERLLLPPRPAGRYPGGGAGPMEDGSAPSAMDAIGGGDPSILETLPAILSNLHDFFFHVAAREEALHSLVEAAKQAYLAERRRRGDDRDPFIEADRREELKKTKGRSQHGLQIGPMTTPPPQGVAVQSVLQGTMSSIGSGLTSAGTTSSLFGNTLASSTQPASTPAAPRTGTTSLFGAPSVSGTGGATSSSLFGTPVASSSSAASASGSLFGSMTAGFSGGSLFGTTSGSLFGGANAAASTGGLFGTSSFGTPGTTGTSGGSLFGFGSTPSAVSASTAPK